MSVCLRASREAFFAVVEETCSSTEESLLCSLEGFYSKHIAELVTLASTDDNDCEAILDAGELDDARKVVLIGLSKLQSTKELARKWQSTMVNLQVEVSVALKQIVGEVIRAQMCDFLVAKFEEQMVPVRRRYASPTCVQACFTKNEGRR